MAKKTCTRRELLDRWRVIDEEDESMWSDPSKQSHVRQLKEKWFSDTFSFLICLQKDTHIWCGSWDLMGPLLETFYNYFKDERDDSPLKILWGRISQEMRQCTQCICQHHQAQEMYNAEYEASCVGPLLKVLRILDEERVTQHLKDINARIARGEMGSKGYNAEVVSVMFEVLMFPVLLEDQSLVTEFQSFIEAVDDTHELTLAGHQQYPGVYALLFLKSRRVRAIGLRLAGFNGKLRRAADLEPLQPLLKKFIGYLETEVLPSALETSRPRVQLDRITVWLGIKALLGFLEPLAFEEGILERYPIFLSIVLNHVSDDSLEFTHAVNCLRLLFEMLGCKLWLRTTLSPGVMRNTLLGQCFHTRNERSHKEIFDLFQPFLQSLEALQDGEHEKQRRHFLYFLLHQVKMSSNFSVLMRKKACQIALFIIHRGYKMNPPCPPFECAHMWGPSLVYSLRDSSLHDSLRQPAFDLIHTIIVSDSAALIISLMKLYTHESPEGRMGFDFKDDEDELMFSHDIEEKDSSCWNEFGVQNKLTSRECNGWMCIPMLWFEVLIETNISVFPISFFKAVFWALSRLSMVELESSKDLELPVRDWISSYAEKISFVWEIPTGSDDGGDGKLSKNSIDASSMCIPLVKTFKRLTAQFVIQMEVAERWTQWTWEPRMSESLILLLVDPNDNVRQVDRLVLEHVSKTRGLASGLKFLCSCGSSLFAIYLGLKHAMTLVQLDFIMSNFHRLHHLFFVVGKLLKEAVESSQKRPGCEGDRSQFSSQGGFLRQPVFSDLLIDLTESDMVDPESWKKFIRSVSEVSWPSLIKCLARGKGFINDKNSQMTCVRLLEILPVVFEGLCSPLYKLSGMEICVADLKWLLDLVDWGKSSQSTVTRYWKQSLTVLLDLLKRIPHQGSSGVLMAAEMLISSDDVAVDTLKEHLSQLSVSLSKEVVGIPKAKDCFEFNRKGVAFNKEGPFLEKAEVVVIDSPAIVKSKSMDRVVILSDDEEEEKLSSIMTDLSCNKALGSLLKGSTVDSSDDKGISIDEHDGKSVSVVSTLKKLPEVDQFVGRAENSRILSQKEKYDASKGQVQPVYPDQSKSVIDTREEVKNICTTEKGPQSQHNDHTFRKGSSDRAVCLKNTQQSPTLETSGASSNPVKTDTTLKESVPDTENDPWERALNAARYQQSSQTKSGPSVPKRKIIQLNVPGDNRSGYIRKLDAGGRRLKPPRLDDWYKPILELDYFSAVGLSSSNEDENANATKLQEVPVCFESPEHYVDIFRPLVLEEFKAQLHSSFMEASSAEEMCCGSISVLSVERVDDFHHIRCIPSDNGSAASRCFENDLVLLTKNPLQNSAHEIHMIGKVERREKDNRRSCIIVIRFYFQNGSLRLNKAKRFLTERSKWYINRIMSITPQLREFQALSSLKDIPILPIILNPTIRPSGDHEFSEIALRKLSQPLQHAFKSSFNDSQLQAISSSIRALPRSEFELSLIQGPPGTGKTRTILAIVSGLLAVSSEQKNYADKKQNNNLRQSNTSSNNSRPKISQSAAIARAWQDAAFARQLTDDGESRSESVNNSTRVRVLICAQSNAAVDELVSRISTEGLYGCDGKSFKPYLVRVGNAKTLHPASLPFFIDTLVDQRLTEEKMNDCDKRNDLSGDNPVVLRSNLEKLVDLIRKCEAKRASIRDGHTDPKCLPGDGTVKEDDDKDVSDADVSAKLNRLYEQKREICKDLAVAQARERKTSEESKALRSKLRKTILREAEIVVTTLSGAGGDLYGVCSESFSNYKFGSSSENTLFDAVVIDEAAQALEPATLIPLQLLKSSRTKCIMVGDPKQLPATVLSHVASKFLYECSMFERLQRAGHPVVMLSKQYRMHPEICKFPSLHFYDSKLLNGDQMASKVAPFHANKYLGPYMFFDVIDGQESHGKNSGAMSLCNDSEASVAIEVLRLFSKRYPSEFVGGRIGIISPYKSQVSLLRSRFSNVFGSSVTADVEFNTVDGFQGREVDILILSTVRASDQGSGNGGKSSMIGFVADVRRMNVALTRAKLSLWIVGNAKTLRTNQNWAALIKNAKERNLVKTMARPYASKFTKSSSASRQESFVGSYSKHVKLDEKVKDTSKGLNQPKGHAKEKNGRKSEVVSNDGSSPSCMPNTDGNHNTSVNRDDPPDVPSEDRKPSIEVQNAPNNRGKGRDVGKTLDKFSGAVHAGKSKILGEKSNHDTNEALLQNQIDSSRSAKNLSTLKGAGECSEHNTGESKPGISHSSTGNHHQDSELKDGSQIMNMKNAPKDLITARKRQRDAVAALLPSGLLSSKKSETASKSKTVKRPPSPTATASTKRPRPGEDTSATVLQDTSTLPAHQQARPPKIKRPVSKHQRNC